jgi:hypothetical protein
MTHNSDIERLDEQILGPIPEETLEELDIIEQLVEESGFDLDIFSCQNIPEGK